jgi:hypothetical protein
VISLGVSNISIYLSFYLIPNKKASILQVGELQIINIRVKSGDINGDNKQSGH